MSREIHGYNRPRARGKLYSDGTLPGFGVKIPPGGSKSFILTVGRERKRITAVKLSRLSYWRLVSFAPVSAHRSANLRKVALALHADRYRPAISAPENGLRSTTRFRS